MSTYTPHSLKPKDSTDSRICKKWISKLIHSAILIYRAVCRWNETLRDATNGTGPADPRRLHESHLSLERITDMVVTSGHGEVCKYGTENGQYVVLPFPTSNLVERGFSAVCVQNVTEPKSVRRPSREADQYATSHWTDNEISSGSGFALTVACTHAVHLMYSQVCVQDVPVHTVCKAA